MQRSIQRDIGIGIAASLISTAAIGGGTYMTGCFGPPSKMP